MNFHKDSAPPSYTQILSLSLLSLSLPLPLTYTFVMLGWPLLGKHFVTEPLCHTSSHPVSFPPPQTWKPSILNCHPKTEPGFRATKNLSHCRVIIAYHRSHDFFSSHPAQQSATLRVQTGGPCVPAGPADVLNEGDLD